MKATMFRGTYNIPFCSSEYTPCVPSNNVTPKQSESAVVIPVVIPEKPSERAVVIPENDGNPCVIPENEEYRSVTFFFSLVNNKYLICE